MKQVPNTILLVEDEMEIAETLTDVLEAKGYEVIHVKSGEEAWRRFLLTYELICAIICDGNVIPSEIDPVELVRKLKKLHATIPFIPMSSTMKWNNDMMSAGASGPVVQKPISFDALIKALPKPQGPRKQLLDVHY